MALADVRQNETMVHLLEALDAGQDIGHQQQELPICPNPDAPDACNVYKDLQFPDVVYESISDYHEQKSE